MNSNLQEDKKSPDSCTTAATSSNSTSGDKANKKKRRKRKQYTFAVKGATLTAVEALERQGEDMKSISKRLEVSESSIRTFKGTVRRLKRQSVTPKVGQLLGRGAERWTIFTP
jgi:translation initiation factor 1 (eIF-1/SUI1)